MNFNRERIRVEVKEMEKYIQIYELSEATENETVCACYPESCKYVKSRKRCNGRKMQVISMENRIYT